jgi:5-methylcytosine-specific restriction endonuclease McrBC regulatory subunit McrC
MSGVLMKPVDFAVLRGEIDSRQRRIFEMNTLFEKYVARMLRRALAGNEFSVHPQGGRLYCLEDIDGGTKRFMTKPDILVKRGALVELIIDTKWKRLSARIDDPAQGVSQADVYQMMAYGHIYRCSRLMLLYPHHADLSSVRRRYQQPSCEGKRRSVGDSHDRHFDKPEIAGAPARA